MRFNGPITLADSEPEPDIAIVRLPETTYRDRHPTPADIFWLIEVAQTSLAIDLEVKAALYATAAILECWVIDLTVPQLHSLCQPQAGQYRDIQTRREGTLTPLAFPEITIALEHLLA
ncbi:Uma2 family endonuclease [Trichothermofontia sp.]